MAYVLKAERHLDFPEECRYRYVNSDKEHFKLHSHDHYEIFLTLGEITHVINGKNKKLDSGTLVFVRDFDEHTFFVPEGECAEFLNLAFTKNTFEQLFLYLSDDYLKTDLVSSPMPPTVRLSAMDTRHLYQSFMKLNTIAPDDSAKKKYEVRRLLFSVFTKYFSHRELRADAVPAWLENLFEEIQKPENFTQDSFDLAAASGKSREHTVRLFKKYYGCTPGEYVNSLKLNYAANLLATSTLSVLDVAVSAGFSNLSWFYELFKKQYGTTPLHYKLKLKKHDE